MSLRFVCAHKSCCLRRFLHCVVLGIIANGADFKATFHFFYFYVFFSPYLNFLQGKNMIKIFLTQSRYLHMNHCNYYEISSTSISKVSCSRTATVDALLTISSTYGDNVTHIKVYYISL